MLGPAITSVTADGLRANLFFFLVGGICTAMAFMTLGVINRYGFKTLEDFSGLGRKMPLASFALFIAALSFAGVPSTGGFMAKYMVVNAVINSNFSWLAVILVLMSVLQTAYLFRLVNYMYAKKPKDETKIKEPLKLLIPIFILVAVIIILGVYPSLALDLIQPAILQFPLIP
jgi:NADH:ubiquinone oxidoreductase subunit 2 (subunit N)